MKKVIAYIDGFNMYHAIHKNLPEKYKWLDYRALVEHFLQKDEELVDILFFTATPRWDEQRIKRHHAYMKILGSKLKIGVISGNYTSLKRTFISDKHPVVSPE
jgi:hypothetical protein